MRRAGPTAALVVAVVMLVASGCSGAGERPPPAEDPRRPIITVTSFAFPESETLAEVYGQIGQTEAGLRLLAEALAVMDCTGERWWEAEVYRLQGELLLKQTAADEPQAETCFRHALDIACCQEAKSLELRVITGLSRLWQRQGKRKAAHNLLAPVYGWFTEGFDTADLKDAKALLEELST